MKTPKKKINKSKLMRGINEDSSSLIEDEFYYFALNIAVKLRLLPYNRAVHLQGCILNLFSQEDSQKHEGQTTFDDNDNSIKLELDDEDFDREEYVSMKDITSIMNADCIKEEAEQENMEDADESNFIEPIDSLINVESVKEETGGLPFDDNSETASSNLIPEKSKERYERAYNIFCEWRAHKRLNGANENIMLDYFFEKAKNLKASTLWTTYSMVKSTLQLNENVDISKFNRLVAFLKRKHDDYQPKKAVTLTMENVVKFLNSAPDAEYLLMKLVLIFGLNGVYRRAELCTLKTADIEDRETVVIVTLRDTKTKADRIFTITSECNGISYYRKYVKLRPKHVSNGRFFLYYKNGKCTVQPVGIHTFGAMPKKVAQYLKLPDYNSYTGHCIRKTCASFLANSGADIQTLKVHGKCTDTVCRMCGTHKRIDCEGIKKELS